MPDPMQQENKAAPPVWKTDNPRMERDAVLFASEVILRGGVVIYPTETFYGLGGDPRSRAVIERIYRIKGRDFKKPLPLIASCRKAVEEVVCHWPPTAESLARAFWPGPLTLVLTAIPSLPQELHAFSGKIAVRVSSHPLAHRLADAVGGLLISTSANPAGGPASSRADGIAPQVLLQTDGLIDGGQLAGGRPSTIVDLTVDPPGLARPGCIPWERVCGLLP